MRLGIFQLDPQFVGRTRQVLATLDRRLGIGRIGEVRWIVDPGALLLDFDLTLQIDRHALKVSDHALDLGHPPSLFLDLEFPQADQRFTRLHRLVLPPEVPIRAGHTGHRLRASPAPLR